jgi:DNA-binding transcriptional regulator YiaG
MTEKVNPTPVALLREELNLSREAFGRLLGVATVTVEKWERRERFPSRANRLKLAALSGRPASSFDETDLVAA